MADMKAFNEAIWRVAVTIPEGRVITYGELARIAGYPGYARQVSKALGKAPENLCLPWHRVIAKPGRIAFAVGEPAFERQKELLRDEGVAVLKGRIDLKLYGWSGAGAANPLAAEEFFR